MACTLARPPAIVVMHRGLNDEASTLSLVLERNAKKRAGKTVKSI